MEKQKPNLFGRDYVVEPYQRVLEITGIFVYFACTLVCIAKMYFVFDAGVALTWALGLILGSALLGYVVADFVSGLVHWMGDTFGETDWPVVGPTFIEPFRMHHEDPKDITLHDFVATNGNASFALMLYLIPITIFTPVDGGRISLVILSFSVFFTASIFLTNQFHKWAHMENPPALGRISLK